MYYHKYLVIYNGHCLKQKYNIVQYIDFMYRFHAIMIVMDNIQIDSKPLRNTKKKLLGFADLSCAQSKEVSNVFIIFVHVRIQI